MKKWLKLRKDEKAQALVEFAIILPILLLLVLGMIEFGWLLSAKVTLNGAVREGARAGVVSGSEWKTQAETEAQNAVTSSGLTIVEGDIISADDTTKAGYIIVSITKKIKPIIGLYIPEGSLDAQGNVTMYADAAMRVE